MPEQGYYGTEGNPIADLYSERRVMTPQTSGGSLEPGEYRLRTDLTSGDRIATYELNVGNGTEEAPVFALSESVDSGIVKVRHVYVPGEGWGFVPLCDTGAFTPAYEEFAFWHNSTRYGWHNSLSAIPDSGGIHQWPVQEGETTAIEDIIGNRDLSLNTDFTASEANAVGGRILDPDGADDVASNTDADSPAGNMTIAITLDGGFDGSSAMFEYGDSTETAAVYRAIRSLFSDGLSYTASNGEGDSYSASYTPQSGLIRVVGVLDTDSDEVRIYENGTEKDSAATGGESFNSPATQLHLAQRQDGGFEYGGRIDNPAVDDDVWSGSKIQEDHNDQPWS